MKQLSLFKSTNFEIDITSTRRNIWIELEKYQYAKFVVKKNGRAVAGLQATSISDMPGGGFKEFQSDVERAIVTAQTELEEAKLYIEEFDEAINDLTNYKTTNADVRSRRREIFKMTFLKGMSRHAICYKLAISETLYYKEEQEAIKQFAVRMNCYAISHHSSKRKSGIWVE
ncbi:DUF1492 domain-containing protein [Listeria seeligeri]|uniref:DUF1492 domain-containing protein n=1 Tax=Listeria TaxID=1637 RepID=UPI00162556D7|nr:MULTISPECIES: DUF1492 domain-containing protein [Listeria]MBC1532074.1 DUF1492 domain-containing protein [Listeria seeligeri]MBC1827113.1 DUF1492 domain-containing protein [Listeria seeligeri]MBC1840095.1 DUF1492 domain-containing protein [Listeria seeligeri]MBC6141901.1 DUF1492 domain-containing protein [Listeria seeligeri]MBC6302476.1 DUF1492 domain-containing protein [Listeria immobilis]